MVAGAMGVLLVLGPGSPAARPKISTAAPMARAPLSTTSSTPSTIPLPAEPADLVVEPASTTTTSTSTPPVVPRLAMFIGDSMAFTAAAGLARHAGAWSFTVSNEGINGCGVVRGGPYRYFGAVREMEARCEAWPAAWQEAVERNRPELVVIAIGRWELMDRLHEGRWTNLFDPSFSAYLESEIETAVALARSGGGHVAVFTSPYYRRGTPPGGGTFPEDEPARVDAINALLRRVAERHGVPVVDVGGFLSPEGRYTATVGGVRVRSDGVHLTRETGELLAPWLFPQLQTVLAGPTPTDPPPPSDARAPVA